MMQQRLLILTVLALLWLAVANATCERRTGQDNLINSYNLAKFRLDECRDMGAGSLDPVVLQKAMLLCEEIEVYLETGSWTQAKESIDQLEYSVGQLRDLLKDWDPDSDGLSNYAEFILYGTSWSDEDTDGDGYLDGSEIMRFQTDPLDHCGVPLGVPLETEVLHNCPALENLR